MKKIYAFITKEEPIICFEWFGEAEYIKSRYEVKDYRSFVYKENNEKSLIDALVATREYCKENGPYESELPSLKDLVEDYILLYELEDETEKVKKDIEVEEEKPRPIRRRISTPLVRDLINLATSGHTSVHHGFHTGYHPMVFYFLLIQTVKYPVETIRAVNCYNKKISPKIALLEEDETELRRQLQNLQEDEEYKILCDRMFRVQRMRDADFNEVHSRISKKIKDLYDGPLQEPEAETKIFKKWLWDRRRTLVDLYDELVSNPVYRDILKEINGTWNNIDIEISEANELESSKDENVTLSTLVDASAELRNALLEKIVGQDDVIDKFEKSYFNSEKKYAAGEKRKGPRNVFLFAGSPGVGKTFLAETFADVIKLPYKRFDMSAYSGNNALEGLVGFERTWKSSQPGTLTSFVDSNPRCVLLFDEIEKASQSVILNFLQILDEGICIDKYKNRNVSFHNAIIIFTTNAGRGLYEGAENQELTSLSDKKILDALKTDIDPTTKQPYFPLAIASRLSSYTVLMFNHLKASDIVRVASKDIEHMSKVNAQKYGIKMTGLDMIAPTIMYSMGGKADARNASKKGSQFMDRELYKFMTLVGEDASSTEKKIRGLKWTVDTDNASEEVRELYHGIEDGTIAFFTDCQIENSIHLENRHIKVMSTTDKDEFMRIIHDENVIYAVIDYGYDKKKGKGLSVVDCKSKGRDAFEITKSECPELDIFILENKTTPFSAIEKKDLLKKGCSGFVFVDDNFINSEAIEKIYYDVSNQMSMEKMFVRHQVLTYDVAHYFNSQNNIGEIKIYNLRLETVLDTDDAEEFIGSDVMPNVHWDDIRISEKLKEELKFVVRYLKKPKEFKKQQLRAPKGVLLYGPPGTGKTTLAKVVATEADMNFIAIGGDELRDGGAEKVKRIFQVAKKYAPTILFIDEVDAIGLDRNITGMNSALNRLLIEMDGFKKTEGKNVFVMAATNLGDEIDAALERRFDNKIYVPLPNKEDRKWLFEFFIQKYKERFVDVTEDEINALVVRSSGFSPAKIEKVIDRAYQEAIRLDIFIDDKKLDDIFEECLFGEAHRGVKVEDLQHTAIHEAGHVICNAAMNTIPNYMTIIGRGRFNGYVIPGENEKSHVSKQDILNSICTSLGGRAAEIVFLGEGGLTPGIAQDIKKATYYAQCMVCEWAMYGDEIGLSVIDKERLHYHPEAQKLINQILSEQMARAIKIVTEHRPAVETLVYRIMSSESKSLTKKEIKEIVKNEVFDM